MLVRTAAGGEREFRGFEFDPSAIPPPSMSGLSSLARWPSPGGQIWRPLDALAIPAVAAAVHLIAETIGSLPLLVYRTSSEGARERAIDAWQYRLLHDRGPNEDATPFDFLADVAACVETYGNAYVEKLPLGRGELELHVLDPGRVQVKLERDGSKTFVVRTQDRRTVELRSDRVLHVRGFTIDGAVTGLPPIAVHRRALGLLASREEYELQFYANNASPGGVIELPAGAGFSDDDQYADFRRRWRAGHEGLARAHMVGILTNGATWKTTGVTPAEAQLTEAATLGVEEVARIFNVPPSLLGVQTTRPVTAEHDADRFYKFTLAPRLRRIERALAADPDLFPPDSGLHPEFLPDALLRADTQTRYDAYKAARQAGWLTANEIRALENYGPDPRGDELQATPVGGAPNQ